MIERSESVDNYIMQIIYSIKGPMCQTVTLNILAVCITICITILKRPATFFSCSEYQNGRGNRTWYEKQLQEVSSLQAGDTTENPSQNALRGVFLVRPAWACSNGWKSLMRPNDGKHIAKGKGVHREVVIDLSLRLSKNLKEAGGKSLVWWTETAYKAYM